MKIVYSIPIRAFFGLRNGDDIVPEDLDVVYKIIYDLRDAGRFDGGDGQSTGEVCDTHDIPITRGALICGFWKCTTQDQ